MKYPLTEKQIAPYRPKPFFFITTNKREELTYDEVYSSLKRLKETGFGGIVLFNKPQSGFNETNYLGEDWFYMVENVAKACKDLGLIMWINDGYDYPPGAVAGKVEKIAPHLKQKHIKLVDGKPTVLEADWGFPAFEEPLSGELFRKLVYEEYYRHVGKYFGDPIEAFFSDTDNRRVQPSVMFDENSPMRDYFPWSTDFKKDFKKEYGYDIMPFMTDVLKRKNIPQAEDYWEFAGRLMQRWFKGNHEWVNAHGLKYTGHSSDSSPYLQTVAPRSSCFTEGRFSDVQRNFDFPGTDHELYAIDCGKHMVLQNMYYPRAIWGETLLVPKMTRFADVSEDMRPKQTASTAFMYKKEGVMCEMFAGSNYGVEPSVLKHISTFQIIQGVTRVVVSEYNHKYLGEVKYFAPPDYAQYSTLQYSMDVINKEIAEFACMMEKGRSVCPVVLIDPTEYVWKNDYDNAPYFKAFAELNRLPYGFTICDTDKIIEKDFGFKVAVYAGIKLSPEKRKKIESKGIVVLSGDRLDEIAKYVKVDVKYEGEGTPLFSRKIIDGEEFTFIANVESETPIKGKIHAYGKSKELVLYPGDVRYISLNYDDIPDTVHGEKICELPEIAPVRFEKPNIVQLEYFKAEGKTVSKIDNDPKIDFTFTAKDELKGLKLYIPKNCEKALGSVALDGTPLVFSYGKIFDEEYFVYPLPDIKTGAHVISIEKEGAFKYYDRIILEGEFDAEIKTDKTYYKEIMFLYNIEIFIPKNAEISLSKRSETLKTDESVALQGQPFYSGAITYDFKVNAPENGKYLLKFPLVRDAAFVTVNGEFAGKIVKPPYEYEISLLRGENDISVKVYNTMANAMECYLEPGGLVSKGVIEKLP